MALIDVLADSIAGWLAGTALKASVLMLAGTLAMAALRQPARRQRAGEWILAGCLLVALVPCFPRLPHWSLNLAPVTGALDFRVSSAETSVSPPSPRAVPITEGNVPQRAVPSAPAGSVPRATPGRSADLMPETPVPSAGQPDRSPAASPALGRFAPYLAAGLFGLGFIASLGWFALGCLAAWRIRRKALPVPREVHDLWRQVSADGPVRATLLVSTILDRPVSWGWWRPVILLPAGLCGPECRQQLILVLEHERVHLRRRDVLTWILVAISRSFFFYHPCFWWIRRQIRLSQEFVADAVAADRMGSRAQYARHLLEMAQGVSASWRPSTAFVGVIMYSSDVYRRIKMLTQSKRAIHSESGRRWNLVASSLAGAAAIALSLLSPQAALPIDDDPIALGPGLDVSASGMPRDFGVRHLEEDRERAIPEMVATLEQSIAKADREGRSRLAEYLAGQLEEARKRLEGKSTQESDAWELHVISLHQGAMYRPDRGFARVKVTHTGAPLIVVVIGYESIQWQFELAEQVQLKQVIVGGYKPQFISGLPKDVPIADFSRNLPDSGKNLPYAHGRDRSDGADRAFAELATKLLNLTGLPICTFQAQSDAAHQPTLVGPESAAWCRDHAWQVLYPAYQTATLEGRSRIWEELAQLRFRALSWSQFAGQKTIAYVGEHSILGPLLGSVERIDADFNRATLDPVTDTVYTTVPSIIRPGGGAQGKVLIPIPAGGLLDNHRCAVAFDAKRNRLLLATLGGVGHLYSYDIASGEWTLVRSMDNLDVSAMCMDSQKDVVYWVTPQYSSSLQLVTMHPEGAILARKMIQGTLDRFLFGAQVSAATAGDYLVLFIITSPIRGSAGPRVLVIDPERAQLVYEGDVLPPQSAEQQLELMRRRNKASLASQAHLAPASTPQELEQVRAKVTLAELQVPAPVMAIRNPYNGHYYELLEDVRLSWDEAKEIAENRRYKGMTGYLATITSESEGEFLALQWTGFPSSWIGASDAEQEGVWKWVTGPEAGTVFWNEKEGGEPPGLPGWVTPTDDMDIEDRDYGDWGPSQWMGASKDALGSRILIEYSAADEESTAGG